MQVFVGCFGFFADFSPLSGNFYTLLLLYPIRQDLLLMLFQAIKFKKLNKKIYIVFSIFFFKIIQLHLSA